MLVPSPSSCSFHGHDRNSPMMQMKPNPLTCILHAGAVGCSPSSADEPPLEMVTKPSFSRARRRQKDHGSDVVVFPTNPSRSERLRRLKPLVEVGFICWRSCPWFAARGQPLCAPGCSRGPCRALVWLRRRCSVWNIKLAITSRMPDTQSLISTFCRKASKRVGMRTG